MAFSYDFKQVHFPDITHATNAIGNHPLQNLFSGITDLGKDIVSGLDARNVSTIKNAIHTGTQDGKKINDIVGELRSNNPNFTEGQFDRADIQKFRDKESEINFRNAQMEQQKLTTKKLQDEMNYLSQTRDADALLAKVIKQGLESGEAAKYAMAAIYNDPEFQRKLAANPQALAKINDLWATRGWNTKLIAEDASAPSYDPHTALTAFQKVIGDISSKVGGMPGDWNTNPAFRDKEATFKSLTDNIKDPEDVASIREDFEKALDKVNAKYSGLPEAFKLALVASSVDKNYWPFTAPFNFGNLDSKLERLGLNDLTYIQDSLNMIYNYGPAQQELQKVISERTIDKLIAARDTMKKSITNNSNLTPAQKELALKQIDADHSKTLRTILQNTTTAIRDSGSGEIRRIVNPDATDSEKRQNLIKAQKLKEDENARKFLLMTSGE